MKTPYLSIVAYYGDFVNAKSISLLDLLDFDRKFPARVSGDGELVAVNDFFDECEWQSDSDDEIAQDADQRSR